MNLFYRSCLFSLLLHAGAIFFFVYYVKNDVKVKPVIIELSITQFSDGLKGDSAKNPSHKGNKASHAADKPNPRSKTARQITTIQVKPSPENAAQRKPVEKMIQPVPRPVRSPQVVHEQQPSSDSRLSSGKQVTGETHSIDSTGSESGKPAQAGGGAQANGKSGGSGTGGGSGNGTVNSLEQQRKKYLNEHFAYIQKIIQDHVSYPSRAKREGLTGKAMASFLILENGQVANIRIISSTGYEILDINLIETIKDVAPFPKPPIKAELHIPYTYRLDH